jgi:hypothetical protein
MQKKEVAAVTAVAVTAAAAMRVHQLLMTKSSGQGQGENFLIK